MLLVLDEPKRPSNIKDHRLDFDDARHRFEWETAIVRPSHPGKDGRPRFKALGFLDGRLIVSPLGTEALSVISLRPASRKERRLYAQG